MSFFDDQRIAPEKFGLDIHGLRTGRYADQYFNNAVALLEALAREQARMEVLQDHIPLRAGNIRVEAQIFHRRQPYAIVAGIDHALAQLKYGCGIYMGTNDQDRHVWQHQTDHTRVQALQDGDRVPYGGDPTIVSPVMRIHGMYRTFAKLETSMLGVLSRASRIATQVYFAFHAAGGKPIFFFPARFDMPDVQAIDGYAYYIGAKRYQHDTCKTVVPMVGTNAAGSLWGGEGMGTTAHATIACFAGMSSHMMIQFAEQLPPAIPRVLLADFHNDCVQDIVETMDAYWTRFESAILADNVEDMLRWNLNGVRLDTSGDLVDKSQPAGSEPGVTPALVQTVRAAIDGRWHSWDTAPDNRAAARMFCKGVNITVSGGFNEDKIRRFEAAGAPVDSYGVGSSLFTNDKRTNTDFTMDIVRLKANGTWHDVAKVGRQAGDNPMLRDVVL